MNSDRDIGEVLIGLKNELLDSAMTRFELLKGELAESATVLKHASPLVLAAVPLLVTGFLLFTAAVVVLIAAAFHDDIYRWFFGTLIVAVVWSLAGFLSLYLAIRSVKMHPILPVKTLQVLRGDKDRLENMKGILDEHGETGTQRDRAA